MMDEATTAVTPSDPCTPSPSTVCRPPPCEAKTQTPTNLSTSTHGGEAAGNRRPQLNARSSPTTDNSPRAPTKDNPRQARDPATTNNPDQPTNGKGCSIFFYNDGLCIFYSWGGTHKFGKLFYLDARARGGRKQAPTAEREERPARRQQRPSTINKSLGKQKTTSEDPTNTTNSQP